MMGYSDDAWFPSNEQPWGRPPEPCRVGAWLCQKAPQVGQKVRTLGLISSSRKGGKLETEFISYSMTESAIPGT